MVRKNPLRHGRSWDATWNTCGGCRVIDPSCEFCYAPWRCAGVQTATNTALHMGTTEQDDHGKHTWNGHLTHLPPDHPAWNFPLDWKGSAKPLLGAEKPSLIFIGSMADLFLPGRPPEIIDRTLTTVAHSHHIGEVLSRHTKPMSKYFRKQAAWRRKKLWLGFSAGHQEWFDIRWKRMRPLAEQGWTVFASLQPLLERIVLPPDFLELAKWVWVSGEQFPGNREMDLDWARSLRDQAQAASLPIFIRHATRLWLPPDLHIRDFPKV
jgi:protein gp37